MSEHFASATGATQQSVWVYCACGHVEKEFWNRYAENDALLALEQRLQRHIALAADKAGSAEPDEYHEIVGMVLVAAQLVAEADLSVTSLKDFETHHQHLRDCLAQLQAFDKAQDKAVDAE